MASLSSFGIPSLATGILQPALEHKWMITFKAAGLSRDESNFISRQAIRFKTNLVDKTISFDIQQTQIQPEVLFNAVEKLVAAPSLVAVKLLMGFESYDEMTDKVSTMEYRLLKSVSHEFVLDYALTDVATHKIVMKFKAVNGT